MSILSDQCFMEWGKIGENVNFWCISKLGVQIFMKLWYLTLFFVFWKRRVVA